VAELFFLVGPTAVGKSSLAIEVAEEIGAEIVNADAFQIYRGLDTLTAKPGAEAQQRVRHHLLNAVELEEVMSAAKFRSLALTAFEQIRARGKSTIVVSGSGLYVRALTHGFDRAVPPNAELRVELNERSPEELADRLRQLDPVRAAQTDLKNPRRVIRAIEIAEDRSNTNRGKARARDGEDSACGICLVRDRDDLNARINERVHAMFREGVEAEVAGLKHVGPTATQALGLREIQKLLAGETSRDECIAKIQQATRRYAKRQLTWFRHQTNFPQLNLTTLSHREAVGAIMRILAQE
jgi:tRNA dimethylallyltransferase